MRHNYNKHTMKKLISYLFVLSVLMTAMACKNAGLKRTKSGLLYKIITDGKSPLVKKGQFLKLSYTQKIHDSIISSSTETIPAYVRVDSLGPNYNAMEIFPLVRKGDSAVVIQLADSIRKKSGQPLPPFVKKKDKFVLTFKVLDVFDKQDLVMSDREAEINKLHQKETKEVGDYIAAHKIDAQKTAKGTFVEVKSVGDGPAVDSGKQVSVRYTGKFLPSGKVFESNMTPPGNEPIKFVVGRKGGMIEGWDDGLRLFKKGGKGTLYIPAYLAYDAQPGPGNKPFENLIFDVEIIDVTDAPKQPEKPVTPPPSAQNQKTTTPSAQQKGSKTK